MRTPTLLSTTACLLALCGSVAVYGAYTPQQTAAAVNPDGTISPAAQNALIQQYCVVCHDDAQKTGGLTLQHFDATHPDPSVAGNMVDKLKAGAMPPAGMPRPDAGTLYALTNALSSDVVGQPMPSHEPAAAPAAERSSDGGGAGASGVRSAGASAPATVVSFAHTGDRMTVATQDALVHSICTQCHVDKRRPGGVSFEHLSFDQILAQPELAERMIAKLRAGMMPPQDAPTRPDQASIQAFVVSLEQRIDRAAAAHPDPGSRVSQRLNRVEYASSIKSMLGLDLDVSQWLPPDTMSHNFDNIAAVQDFSPTLLQSYLEAAGEISRLAVGDRTAAPTSVSYDVGQFTNQVHHVADAPLGTRGGLAVTHIFPADGTYRFKLILFSTLGGRLFGLTTMGEQVQIAIDDRPVALLDVDPRMSEAVEGGLTLETEAIQIAAGEHRVSAAFLQRAEGPIDDLISPQGYTLADLDIGDAKGLTLFPHLRTVTISGPFKVTGIADTVSREKIFICRPTSAADETPCAQKIVGNLARQAYRGPATPAELDALMKFYGQGRAEGDFETGIRMALQALLVSPHFLFRIEPQPASVDAGETYPVSDLALASRLSYFLWAQPPDSRLVQLARAGRLHQTTVLDAEVRRMLKDPKASALSTRFAAQWLRLQDVSKMRPDAVKYPMYDANLQKAMVQETEQFFDGIVRDDRSVIDLLTADYTYVNERLAAFYGIPNVAGPEFRRVSLAGTHREGLLGQGSILVETSVANRTDPVLRGKWVLEVLLGQPPPPPPPNVPPLEATGAVSANGKPLTVRQRMEEHRKNPFCASCHKVIDPIGLALENFQPTGRWRVADNDVPVDTSTVLYDGTAMKGLDGPEGLVHALLNHQDTFLRVFTENLMAYALGRQVEYFDMPTVRAIIQDASRHDHQFSSFVLGIVNSSAFRMNRAAAVETSAAPREP